MVILNNEGAGTICGQYNGKQSPEFRHGILNGGNFNRWIVNDLQRELNYQSLPFVNICPELSNVDEATRVARLNSYAMYFKTFALSIYTSTGERSGIRILGNTREHSDKIGQVLYDEMCTNMDGWNMPVDKINYNLEEEIAILEKSRCPSFIIYAGSVDLFFDYMRMINVKYQQSLVDALYNTINNVCEILDQD